MNILVTFLKMSKQTCIIVYVFIVASFITNINCSRSHSKFLQLQTTSIHSIHSMQRYFPNPISCSPSTLDMCSAKGFFFCSIFVTIFFFLEDKFFTMLCLCPHFVGEVSFFGGSGVSLSLEQTTRSLGTTFISFRFKTHRPNGLILYVPAVSSVPDSFLGLWLDQGILHVSPYFDLSLPHLHDE